ncbi:HSP20-like chaperone [Chytriomyces sp. MP71]|nr:HSP20-like chaperone [Chytriomyces sp. MP71]
MEWFNIKRDPFFRDFDRIVSGHLDGTLTDSLVSSFWGTFATRMDVHETAGSYVIEAEMCGVAKDKVDVSVKDGVLTLCGERATTAEADGRTPLLIERAKGRFCRSLTLPRNANADDVQASLIDGVLSLTIAKRDKDEGVKKIAIGSH